jgi:hypothetical protein
MNRALLFPLPLVAALATACASPPPPAAPAPSPPVAAAFDRASAEREIGRELDDMNDAAARADEPRYLAHFAPGAVFLGTDASERWDLAALRAYAHPRFSQGKGWAIHSVRRTLDFAPGGVVAWFEEDLAGDKLGPARGSGVVSLVQGRWLVAQYNLALTVPNERFGEVRTLIDAGEPAAALHARQKRAYAEATAAAAAGELGAAASRLDALVPEAKKLPGDDLEFWLHNQLTWIRWAQGDRAGARAEVERAQTARDHATLDEAATGKLRLHERWDRAYLALDDALAAPAARRARAMAEADAARADYEAIAKPADDHDGMAVLAAFFAARRHQGKAAATAAKRVDVEKDDDLQDLYVIALALDAGGEADAAQRVRARICAAKEYLMKPLLLRAMAAEGHGCGAK